MKQKPIISLEKNKALLIPYVVSSFIKKSFWNPRLGSIRAECRSCTTTTYRWADLASGKLTIWSKITGFWQSLLHVPYNNKRSNLKNERLQHKKKTLVGATQNMWNASLSSPQTCLWLHQGQTAASYKYFLAL